MSIDRFTLHSRGLGLSASSWLGRERPLDVQGSGLERTVSAEMGDDGADAKARSGGDAQKFLVVVALKQEIVSAIPVDIGVLRLPGDKATHVMHPVTRLAEAPY